MLKTRLAVVALLAPLAGCSSSSSSPDLMDDTNDTGDMNESTFTISANNAESLLREVVMVANDDALNNAAQSLEPVFGILETLVSQVESSGTASDHGLTYLSILDVDVGGDLREYTFSCDSGGTLLARAYPVDPPRVESLEAISACSIDDAAYEGSAFRQVQFNRTPDSSVFENFSISQADGDLLLLHGEFLDTGFGNTGPVTESSWTDATLLVVDDGETSRIEGYNSFRRSVEQNSIPDLAAGATAEVSFTVTAPWTSGEPLDVDVNLAYVNTTEAPASQWQTGTVRVIAADGSGLTLSPETDSPDTFALSIDGDSGDPLILNWADGFQIGCATSPECN